jgi:elongation factor Tu
LVAAALLMGGCAQDEMSWSGTPPAFVEMERSGGGSPIITATDRDGNTFRLLIDTGHPGALLASQEGFSNVDAAGFTFLDLELFGLDFRGIPTTMTTRVGPSTTGFDGILGAGVLRHFALDLDYVGQRASLRPDEDGDVSQRLPELSDVGDEQVFLLSPTGLDGSRLAFNAVIEGRDSQAWIDTGAVHPVAYRELQPLLEDDPDRPRLLGISALTTRGVEQGFLTRVADVEVAQAARVGDSEGEAKIAEAPEEVAPLALFSVPAMVFPERREPADIFNHRLAMSVGTSVLERYVSRIDYKHSRLHLWPHNDTTRFVDNPWRDLGFALALGGEGFTVLGVWQDTVAADADGQGEVRADKPHVNIGTIGHVDHGKTTLTAAITKVLASQGQARPIELRRDRQGSRGAERGITINTAHVEYETDKPSLRPRRLPRSRRLRQEHDHRRRPDGRRDPGGGATDGPMPRRVSTSCSPARSACPPSWCSSTRSTWSTTRSSSSSSSWRSASCSAATSSPATTSRSSAARRSRPRGRQRRSRTWVDKILELMDAVDEYIPEPEREIDKPFLMPVEDVFSIKGRGTVVTGRIERGKVKVGDEVEIVGIKDTRKTTVTGVEMFRKLLDEGQAGDNVGCLLRGIKKEDIERGQVLAKPGSITPHTKFKARSTCSPRKRAAATRRSSAGYRPQFYFRTTDVTGTIMPCDVDGAEMVMPGDNVDHRGRAHHPIAMDAAAALRHPRGWPHRRRRRRHQDRRPAASRR